MGNCRDVCLGDNSEWDGNVSLNGELIGWDTAPSQGQPSRGGHVPLCDKVGVLVPSQSAGSDGVHCLLGPIAICPYDCCLTGLLESLSRKAMSSLRHQTPWMFWLP